MITVEAVLRMCKGKKWEVTPQHLLRLNDKRLYCPITWAHHIVFGGYLDPSHWGDAAYELGLMDAYQIVDLADRVPLVLMDMIQEA